MTIGSPRNALANEPEMIIVRISPHEGGSETQNGRFPSKIALHLKKVSYKVSFVNTVSDSGVRHSLA